MTFSKSNINEQIVESLSHMPELTEEMKAARESWAKRWEEYKPAREEQFRIKENKARRESKLNTEFAKKLREEYK